MLESANLLLRESTFEDCDFFAEWEAIDDAIKYLSIDDGRKYRDVVKEFIMRDGDQSWEQFTIIEKETGEPIGRIILSKVNRMRDSLNFFRIYIGKASKRRQGFGEEAMRAVLEYAFINLHMERIALDHLKEDRIMQNLCAKLGFKTEGIMRHAGKRNGKYDDLCRESLLRAEYYDKIHIQ